MKSLHGRLDTAAARHRQHLSLRGLRGCVQADSGEQMTEKEADKVIEDYCKVGAESVVCTVPQCERRDCTFCRTLVLVLKAALALVKAVYAHLECLYLSHLELTSLAADPQLCTSHSSCILQMLLLL
eukprot:6207611-Pleurochrysis_carterae.AAC.4